MKDSLNPKFDFENFAVRDGWPYPVIPFDKKNKVITNEDKVI